MLKALRNYILRIITVWSLFFQQGFIEVSVLHLLFWETSFFFVLLCFMCLLFLIKFKFDVMFMELQHLYSHCFYKCHLAICDFVLTL